MNKRDRDIQEILSQLTGDPGEVVSMNYTFVTEDGKSLDGNGMGFPVKFVHPMYHVGWRFDGFPSWVKCHRKWTRLTYEEHPVWNEDAAHFDEIIRWGKETLVGEWNTFNGIQWAFSDANDAMLFKLRWGATDPDDANDI
jgi:hypothetical protein